MTEVLEHFEGDACFTSDPIKFVISYMSQKYETEKGLMYRYLTWENRDKLKSCCQSPV